jgi:hypothetical protein
VMPSFVTDEHRKVGDAKVGCAIQHLDAAREALDAACRDLCSVINGNRAYRDIARLSDSVRDQRNELQSTLNLRTVDYALDREPVPDDFTNPHLKGCGMTPEEGS